MGQIFRNQYARITLFLQLHSYSFVGEDVGFASANRCVCPFAGSFIKEFSYFGLMRLFDLSFIDSGSLFVKKEMKL